MFYLVEKNVECKIKSECVCGSFFFFIKKTQKNTKKIIFYLDKCIYLYTCIYTFYQDNNLSVAQNICVRAFDTFVKKIL